MKFRIPFKIIIIALVFTLITSQIRYYDDFQGVSTQPDARDSIQGFPFPINRVVYPSVVLPPAVTINIYKSITYSYLFWVTGIIALVFLKKESQKRLKINIILALALGFTLMQIYMSSQSSCIKGYPIKFLPICGGLSPNNLVILFAILDFTFWLIIGFIVVASIRAIEKLPKLLAFVVSYCFIPLIATLLSSVNYSSCSGFFCFGPSGRGFPLYYWVDLYPPVFKLKYFIVDYVFWFMIYLIIRVTWNFIHVLKNKKR